MNTPLDDLTVQVLLMLSLKENPQITPGSIRHALLDLNALRAELTRLTNPKDKRPC